MVIMTAWFPLKKFSDPEQLSSYRPVATIPFLAKVVEKLVSHHLNVAGCLDPNLHAYKAMHSCETALLTVINDALLAIDDGMVLPLILLDMTAAFDLVDHELFFEKCERLGIRESAIDWIRRTQKVSCNGVESESSKLLCGVPQGSVLGPLLFSMYISDIRTVLQKHAVDCVIYADDIQLYTRSSPKDIFSVLLSLEACLRDIHVWLSSQKLVLNPRKTEFIVFSSKTNSTSLNNLSIHLDGQVIPVSSVLRDLGVLLG
jgi:hypothetical protein